MSYTADWSDTVPVDHTKFNQTPGKVRDVRLALSDRLKNLFYGFIGGETQTDEGVKNLPFVVQVSDPGATANKIKAYAKDISAKAELHLEDEDGNVIVVSRAGKIAIDSVLRSGDMLLTSSSTVPTNFTDVSSTYGDKFIRISSGTALSTGGSDTHDHGAATGSHTLTTNEIPAHSHTFNAYTASGAPSYVTGTSSTDGAAQVTTSSVGGGSGHTHTIASANNIPAYVQMKMYKRN